MPLDKVPAQFRVDEAGKQANERSMRKGPRPRIHQHEGPHSVGVTEGIRKADGAAPVVQHEGDIRTPKLLEQALDQGRVGRRSIRKPRRGGRPAEPEVVRSHAAVVGAETGNEVPVQAGTRGVAMEKHHGWPLAHIGVDQIPRGGADRGGGGRSRNGRGHCGWRRLGAKRSIGVGGFYTRNMSGREVNGTPDPAFIA